MRPVRGIGQGEEVNQNSMCYWWPLVKDLGIPVPKTIIAPLDREKVFEFFDGEDVDFPEVHAAAKEIGYPVFLRTDLCSGKHDWKNTCYVENPFALNRHIVNVCEANELWSLAGLPYTSMVVREFLPLETAFTAFSGDMPINKEFRFFVRDGKVICSHFYWPEEAFNSHPARMAHVPDWREQLAKLAEISTEEKILITAAAERAGTVLGGFWSLDFAKTCSGEWYLIDAALGEQSYHWPGCTNG